MFRSFFPNSPGLKPSLMLSAAGAALLLAAPAFAQGTESVTVTAERLAAARDAIQTQVGASTYTITAKDIEAQPGGSNLQLNSVILQVPGVAQDSFGQLHIRGEHNGLQYRLNGIILPEGISVFSQSLDPRLAESVKVIDGALPAEYGLVTGGIVDIQTKSGVFENGGEVSMYGGSHAMLEPSFAYGGSAGHFNFFLSGDYNTNSLGIESPDGSPNPLHDRTKQWHGFAYAQEILDQNSSITAILGTSNAMFQIPNQRGLQPSGIGGVVGLGPLDPGGSGNFLLQANGQTTFPSELLDERQREITHYAILSYLRSEGAFDWQISGFGRYSSLFFTPGNNVGDILYNGIGQTAYKRDQAWGIQAEGAWHWGDSHTIRFGTLYQADDLVSRTSSRVLPVDSGDPVTPPNANPLCTDPAQTCQTSGVPLTVADNNTKHVWSYSLYAQDEWKLLPTLTFNFGVRYDQYQAFDKENQISPRANLVWKPDDATTIHIGYARYFSPPPYELVATTDIALFDNTTAATDHTDNVSKAERADYYDAGVVYKLTDAISVGLDGYFKADSYLIDEGQFGAPIILTPFNYRTGRQYGSEFTASYNAGNFSAYFNAAYERDAGKNIVSSQFNFNPDDLAYVSTHYIPLDHQQIISLSGGTSYNWDGTLFSTTFIYGSGLRAGGATPNGAHVPGYVSVNVGVSRTFDFPDWKGITARFDVINLTDETYHIRSGTGIGVGAPQFGARRGVFFGLSQAL